MDIPDAFCEVVLTLHLGHWSPDRPTRSVNGKLLTPREICQHASQIDRNEKLRGDAHGWLLEIMNDRENQEVLGKDLSYATGAVRLLKWMDRKRR